MHPNLTANCPLKSKETSSRLSLAQAGVVLGTWVGFFALGFALLP